LPFFADLTALKQQGNYQESISAREVPMVFAVQCPNAKCRKYMLVEDHDRNKVVNCLICKTAIKVGGGSSSSGNSRPKQPPK
jgi:hypothetical protein